MKCRNCGKEIPAHLLKKDFFRCPSCGKAYRKRLQSQRNNVRSKSKSRKLDLTILKKKLWKLPVWAWLLIIIIGIVGMAMNEKDDYFVGDSIVTPVPELGTQEPSPSESANPIPEYTPPISEEESASWVERFTENESKVQKYLEDNLSGYNIKNLTVDFWYYEPDIYSAMFDATLYDSSPSGLKAAIEDINVRTSDYRISFGVLFYDKDGNALGTVTWGANMSGVNMAVNGKGYEFDSLDDLLN